MTRRVSRIFATTFFIGAAFTLAGIWPHPPIALAKESGPSGTLRIGAGIDFTTFDPATVPNNTFTSFVFETLVERAADGVTILPRLATEWQEGNGELTFKLREGVQFHDGTQFDASAVVANVKYIQSTPQAWQYLYADVADVVAVDDMTVKFILSRNVPMLRRLSSRGSVMISPKTLQDKSYAKTGVGTGPWVYSPDESVGGTKVVFNYFDKYYDPSQVGARRFEVNVYRDPEVAYNALRAGQIDALTSIAAFTNRARQDGFGVDANPMGVYHLLLLDREDLFKDVRVRKAICHGLDTASIALAQYDGEANLLGQRHYPGTAGYNPSVTGYEHSVERALELMTEAGNPKISTTLPFITSQTQLMTLVQSQMAAIGIEIKLEQLPSSQYFSTFRSGKYAIGYNTATAEDISVYDYYRHTFAADGAGNPFGVKDAELDAIVERALAELDPAKAETIWQKVTQYIHDQALDCGYIDRKYPVIWDTKKVKDVHQTVWDISTWRYREAKPLNQ